THLIGYAVVRALDAVPAMRNTYADTPDGPAVVSHDHVGLGLAVDVPKADGSRTLLVPCIKDADALDFAAFHAAYEDLIRRSRACSWPRSTSCCAGRTGSTATCSGRWACPTRRSGGGPTPTRPTTTTPSASSRSTSRR